jgi:hypothetical protein
MLFCVESMRGEEWSGGSGQLLAKHGIGAYNYL